MSATFVGAECLLSPLQVQTQAVSALRMPVGTLRSCQGKGLGRRTCSGMGLGVLTALRVYYRFSKFSIEYLRSLQCAAVIIKVRIIEFVQLCLMD